MFAARSLPGYAELRATTTAQTIVVRARDGSVIVELGPSYGEWIAHDDIPPVMKNAMIAVEDRRFDWHFGVDPIGLGRALWDAGTGNGRVSATSTITQQLARNLFLNSNRTLDRKMREAVLAMALETKFTKEQILELYLNKVYFGGGAYGIDSASRHFFSHPATDLSTGEAAIIAGLVKAPSRYSPTADVQAAVDRAQVVLRLMKEQQMIPASSSVDPSAVQLKEDRGQNSVRYFTDWALPQLDILLPAETFEPIEVWTTIDIGMQRAAETAVTANVPGGAQGALVSLDRDGAVLALIGGTDYVKTNYNRATDAMRQPGSSWKLFVYLAALEAGYTPESTVKDAPTTIEGWSPRNSGGGYAGEMSLRTAFAYSKNTVAAQLGYEVGFGTVASMARRFGIIDRDFHLPVDGAGQFRNAADRHDARLCRGVGRRPFGRALWHPQGDIVRRGRAVRTQRAARKPAGARLRRGGNDRPVADRGAHRHRQGGADRATGGGQDRHDIVQQGRLFRRLFQRHDHRRVDGPRRQQARRGLAGRTRPGAGLCRLHALCGEGSPGRTVRYRSEPARMAAGAGRRVLFRRSGGLLLHRRAGQSGRTRPPPRCAKMARTRRCRPAICARAISSTARATGWTPVRAMTGRRRATIS